MVGIQLVIYTLGEEEAAYALYRDLLYDGSEQGFIGYRTYARYPIHGECFDRAILKYFASYYR